MDCPVCSQELPNTAKFCLSCGASLGRSCPSCDTSLPTEARFCFSCGCEVSGGKSSNTSAEPEIPLGYCAGNGIAIFTHTKHIRCIQCDKLYSLEFRFENSPICLNCAYAGGIAQQLEKECEGLIVPKSKIPNNCPVTGMEFVVVPGGEFEMGDVWGDGNYNEKPIRLVTVHTFKMAIYPVTQKQWLEVMRGNNPVVSIGERFVGMEKPVVNVSWNDAQEFIKRLNRKSGCIYRLPSEAEWEYAARSGGNRDKYSGTSSEKALSAYAWYGLNSNNQTHSVGKKRPNDLELYDMSGNVWEWCKDVWHDDYTGAPCDGSAWVTEGDVDRRVGRGGSWGYFARSCRVAYRSSNYMGYRNLNLGFRLAQDSI